jgi:hypothetical protein
MIRSMDVRFDISRVGHTIEVIATHVPTGYAVTAVGDTNEGWTEKKVRTEALDSLNSILSD